MIQKNAAGPQETPGLLKEGRKQRLADVLKHADADNLVEAFRGLDVSIIQRLDAAAPGEARRTDTLICQLDLPLAQRYPYYFGAIVLAGMDDQSSPPAADVQKSLAGLKT